MAFAKKKAAVDLSKSFPPEETIKMLGDFVIDPNEEYDDGDYTGSPHPNGYFRSGALALDAVNQGRGFFPRGAMIQVYSESGFGKTTAMLAACKALCQQGIRVFYVMAEPGRELARAMGMFEFPTSLFVALDLYTFNDLQKVTHTFLTSLYDIMIVDSLTSVGMSMETLGETKMEGYMIGVEARMQSQWIKNYHGPITRARKTCVYIMQTRAAIDETKLEKSGVCVNGAEAAKFFADIRLALVGGSPLIGTQMGLDHEAIIGRRGWLMCDKNRHANPFVKVPITIVYGQGVANSDFLRHYLTWKQIAVLSGSWYTVSGVEGLPDGKGQGQAFLIEYIRANMEALIEKFYADSVEFFQWLHTTKSKGISLL
jgi:RecA/RadA recombinase